MWNKVALTLFLAAVVWGQSNACDLNLDGQVDASDVQVAINMDLGLRACTAAVVGTGVCNVVMTQRVINASLGGACITGSIHSVELTWTASTSAGVIGYNVYRAASPGGVTTRLTFTPTTGATYTDTNVQSGATYYYTVTAVNGSNVESVPSNQISAVIPVP